MTCTFDTETSSLPNYKESNLLHPSHGRVIQLSAILHDKDNHLKGEINLLIQPDGWKISPEAQAIHGISQEDCERYGVPFCDAFFLMQSFFSSSDTVIAHNLKFDEKMIHIELAHLVDQKILLQSSSDEFKNKIKNNGFCTMEATTPILKLKGKIPSKYKWPNLQEAYKYYTGENFEGAHDASADTKACHVVYSNIKFKEQMSLDLS